MSELSLFEIIKVAIKSLLSSDVLILFILEALILALFLIFSRLMNKKVVKTTSIIASLVVLGFYITNYVSTLKIFIDNVSTKLIELIYFPTTLEFMVVMFISFGIMIFTLTNKKTTKFIKVINTLLPIGISFLFLSIIEYINATNIAFDEFSVFTNPVLMSLYELAMGLFISWLIGLGIYKIDKYIINKITIKEEIPQENLITVTLPDEDDLIEMPRLKQI